MTLKIGGTRATAAQLRKLRADLGLGMIFDPQDDETHSYDPPINITAGGTYTGNWRSDDPALAAVRISTTAPVTILNSRVESRNHCIASNTDFVNLTVQGCTLRSLNPGVNGSPHQHAVRTWRAASLVVENNNFFGGGGVLAQGGVYLTTTSPLHIRRNRFYNMNGLRSDGTTTGYLPEVGNHTPRQAVQVTQMLDIADAKIEWNQVINQPGLSRMEDGISLIGVSGLTGARFKVCNNYIHGGFTSDPYVIVSGSMTGIIAEADAANLTLARSARFIDIEHNQVVAFSNLGISVQCNNNAIRYNTVVRSRQRMDGLVPYGDNGITIRGSAAQETAGMLGACVAERNHIYTENMAGNNNHSFIDSFQVTAGSTIANNVNGSWPNLAMEGEQWMAWLAKCEFHGVVVGSELRF
jgi:hypothetical protein